MAGLVIETFYKTQQNITNYSVNWAYGIVTNHHRMFYGNIYSFGHHKI